jgi:hypothetical protein
MTRDESAPIQFYDSVGLRPTLTLLVRVASGRPIDTYARAVPRPRFRIPWRPVDSDWASGDY